jgi:hypothetical protein
MHEVATRILNRVTPKDNPPVSHPLNCSWGVCSYDRDVK